MLLPPGASLKVHAGKRFLHLKRGELEGFRGVRAQRGGKLPRGFQNVTLLEVVSDRPEEESEPQPS